MFFVNKHHPEFDSYVLQKKVIAHAARKTSSCEIHLNIKVRWDFDVSFDSEPEDGKISVYAVILHVFGHCLGRCYMTN